MVPLQSSCRRQGEPTCPSLQPEGLSVQGLACEARRMQQLQVPLTVSSCGPAHTHLYIFRSSAGRLVSAGKNAREYRKQEMGSSGKAMQWHWQIDPQVGRRCQYLVLHKLWPGAPCRPPIGLLQMHSISLQHSDTPLDRAAARETRRLCDARLSQRPRRG